MSMMELRDVPKERSYADWLSEYMGHTADRIEALHASMDSTNYAEKYWIQTHSGVKFNLFHIPLQDISIVDIAHALSLVNRYTGHTMRRYSVAEHSVRVARGVQKALSCNYPNLCESERKLIVRSALLHDASEAYLADIARPIKQHPLMDGYYVLQGMVMERIAVKFGFQRAWPILDIVRTWDNILLQAERRDLLKYYIPWGFEIPDINMLYPRTFWNRWGWSARKAEREFLKAARKLDIEV